MSRSQFTSSSTPIIVLDRDGIVNVFNRDYVRTPDEFHFLPGSVEAIAQLTAAGCRIGIATNQSGVSRGYYTEETLADIHAKMCNHVEDAGGRIDEIAYCPHLPSTGCTCRKPNPGMLFTLADKFNCSPKEMLFIGDRITDLQAARNAGSKAILILSPGTDPNTQESYPDVPVFDSLLTCATALIKSWRT